MDEEIRQRLIVAMAESCAERGYLASDVASVCTAAGVSEAEFAKEFKSREECAEAAVEKILAEGMATVGAAYSADTSEWESALAALRDLLELFASRPSSTSLAFTNSRQGMPTTALAHYESGFAILTALLDRLRNDSELGELAPPIAARAAIGGGEALVRREIAGGRADRLPMVLPDLVYSATVPFLGQEQALRLARMGRELVAARNSFGGPARKP
jgi:AcrR family transcriptional regulator